MIIILANLNRFTIFLLEDSLVHLQLNGFFTPRCYASAVLAIDLCLSLCVRLCPSVCHKSEFY